MLSNWFAQPEGSGQSSADEGRGPGENDQDTQVMEPDQGNGMFFPECDTRPFLTSGHLHSKFVLLNALADSSCLYHSPLSHHLSVAAWCRSQSRRPANIHSGTQEHAREDNKVRGLIREICYYIMTANHLPISRWLLCH